MPAPLPANNNNSSSSRPRPRPYRVRLPPNYGATCRLIAYYEYRRAAIATEAATSYRMRGRNNDALRADRECAACTERASAAIHAAPIPFGIMKLPEEDILPALRKMKSRLVKAASRAGRRTIVGLPPRPPPRDPLTIASWLDGILPLLAAPDPEGEMRYDDMQTAAAASDDPAVARAAARAAATPAGLADRDSLGPYGRPPPSQRRLA